MRTGWAAIACSLSAAGARRRGPGTVGKIRLAPELSAEAGPEGLEAIGCRCSPDAGAGEARVRQGAEHEALRVPRIDERHAKHTF